MRGPSASASSGPARREEVFLAYRAFYRGGRCCWAAEGGAPLAPCHDPALKGQARRLLLLAPDAEAARRGGGGGGAAPLLARRPRVDVPRVAESCLRRRRGRQKEEGERRTAGLVVLGRLAKAFEFLELLCVNLFLSPWRKEIRSLKTFTGNFVYYIQSVLPEEVVESLLEDIGYVPTTPTEFSLVKKLNEEEAEQAAFELFLARIECEDLFQMAEDARDSDLVDMLQKRGQKHCSPEGNLDGKDQPTERKECMIASGENEIEGSLGPWSGYWTQDKLDSGRSENTGLRSEFGLGCPAQSELATSEPTHEHDTSQRNQEDAFSTSCVKSSDSEDFLIKYSDIVIGQKPLQFTDLPPKVSDDAAQASGLVGTRLGPPLNEGWPLALLSPDASGPQALAILNDGTLSSTQPYDCRAQDSGRKMTEPRLCDAVSCLNIHRSDPMDQPKELKENCVLCHDKVMAHNFSSEKEVRDLFCNKKLNMQENYMGKLTHPVEETAQAELTNGTSKGDTQHSDHSKTKLAGATGGDREGFINLYSGSDLFRNISACECPTVGSNYTRLLRGIPGFCEASEHFRHAREQPNSCYTTAADTSYHGGIPADIWCQVEGCPFHASSADYDTCVAPMNETSPEGYVIINKDD